MINGMQGCKDAGRSWYLLLRDIFHNFGLRECPSKPALFSFYDGQEELVVCTSTNDFLCSTSSCSLRLHFEQHVKQFVDITVQTGSVLKYLNIRVVQSEFGVSFNQTHHIKTTIIDKWFPPSSTERIKGVDAPF